MSGNLEGGISTGMTGAQIGGQVGGGYGAAIGAVAGFIIGWSNDPEKHLKKRTEEYNKQVTKNVAHSLFDLERQRVSERMRTASAMLGYNAQRSTTLSNLRAQYGAIDVIGSSSNALKQAYAFQLEQAIAQENFNFAVGISNYNTSVLQVVNTGLSQLRYDYKPQNQQSMSPQDISSMIQQGQSMFGGQGGQQGGQQGGFGGFFGGGGDMFSSASKGGSGGSMMTMDTSRMNMGGGGSSGSLGIA